MPNNVKIIIFILLLPFFAGLGHDVYINYFSGSDKIKQIKQLQIDPGKFIASDIGWVWNEYAPENMKAARTMVEPEIWKEQVDPILKLPTMVAGIIPAFVGFVFLLIAFVLGVWPFSQYGRARREKEEDFAVYGHAKSNAVKYNKK